MHVEDDHVSPCINRKSVNITILQKQSLGGEVHVYWWEHGRSNGVGRWDFLSLPESFQWVYNGRCVGVKMAPVRLYVKATYGFTSCTSNSDDQRYFNRYKTLDDYSLRRHHFSNFLRKPRLYIEEYIIGFSQCSNWQRCRIYLDNGLAPNRRYAII